jgi:hypothetical protein
MMCLPMMWLPMMWLLMALAQAQTHGGTVAVLAPWVCASAVVLASV